ncbi:Beta-agarase A precursor [Planctomycetes bacterium MalM25]|nr:Beta-agarase A precursor [Planctomycetes bacterium MalM25]
MNFPTPPWGRGPSRRAKARPSNSAARRVEALERREMLTDFYVSAADGANFPNDGSFDEPFQTIGRAVQFAQAGDTVYIHEGVYREQVNLTRSGFDGSPITFKPYSNESVVVSGGDLVTGWTNQGGDVWTATANWDADGDRDNNTLFVDGELKYEAKQFAENDPLDIDDWGRLKQGRLSSNASSFTVDDLGGFPDDKWNGAKIKFHVNDWTLVTRTITDFDAGSGTISLDSPVGIVSQKQENGYFIYDTLEALDQPGEWYKADGSSTLYYYAEPGQDPNDLDIEFKRREYGFNLNSRDHIHIEGIEFRGVSLDTNSGTDNNVIGGNRFHGYDKGDYGRFILEGSGNVIRDNEFSHTWGSVATINGSGHQIVNNYLHDIGFRGASRVVSASGAVEILVSHNTVSTFARSFMDGYPTRSEIAYNVFEDGGNLSWDTGVFDADGGNGDSSYSIFHHNVFRDTDTRGIFEAFYGRNSNAVVHHNLFYDFDGNGRTVLRSYGLDFRQAFHNTVISSVSGAPSGSLEAREAIQTRYNNNVQITAEDIEALGVDSRGNHDYIPSDFVDFAGKDFRLAPGSDAIDSGIVIPGINDGYLGAAPDAGAFESGQAAWEAGHDFANPPNPVYSWVALPGTNLFDNVQFQEGIVDWSVTSGSPVSSDRNSWNLQASGAPLTGTFRTQSVEFTPGEGMERTFTGLTPGATYTIGVGVRLADRLGDADDFNGSSGTISTGEHRDERYVSGLTAGEWVRYDNVNFGDPGQYDLLDLLHIRDPSDFNQSLDGVSVQVRLDDPAGTLIAEFDDLLDGNTKDRWRADREAIAGISGQHSIYVSVSGANAANLALGSFRLLSSAPVADDLLTIKVESAGVERVSARVGLEDWDYGYEEIVFQTGPAATEATISFANNGRLDAYLDRLYLIEGHSTRGAEPQELAGGAAAHGSLNSTLRAATPELTDGSLATEAVSGDHAGAWLQVDLGDTEALYGLQLITTASQPDRLSNFRVTVWSADPDQGGTELWSQDYLTDSQALGANESLFIQADAEGRDGATELGDVRGRYIRVESLGLNAAGDQRVALSELRVLGFDLNNLATTDGLATQSTDWNGQSADLANDGDDATASATDPGAHNSWWQTAFAQPLSIGQIELQNVDASTYGELSNFTVSVWDEDPADGGTKLWEKSFLSTGSVGRGQTLVIDGSEVSDTSTRRLATVHTGSVVRVQLNGANNEGNGRLSLAGVRVAAGDAITPINNLAQQGAADQRRDFYGDAGFNASNGFAVDANDGLIFPESNFTSTLSESGTWWQVDLQETSDIDQIVLYNRTDAANRLNNFRVTVWDDDPDSGGSELWGRTYFYSDSASTYSTGSTIGAGGALIIDGSDTDGGLRLDNVSGGKYVRVQLLGTNILSLAEVQVWAPNSVLRTSPFATDFSYDLGTESSPVEPGATRVSPSTYGDAWWTGEVDAADRGGSGTARDFVEGYGPATLNHTLPNGYYRVTAQFGDSSVARPDMSLWAEGGLISDGIDATTAGVTEVAFDVTVDDGELNLALDGPVNTGWALSRLVIEEQTPVVTLAGDYNDDGVVDAADYTVWRDAEGTSTFLPNDATPNVVDQSDWQVWRDNYGAALPVSVTTVLIDATAGNGEFEIDNPAAISATGGGGDPLSIDVNRDRAFRSTSGINRGLSVPGWTSTRTGYSGGNAALGFDGNYGFAIDAGTLPGETGQAFVNSGTVDLESDPIAHAFQAGDVIDLSYLLGTDASGAPTVDADVELRFNEGLPSAFTHTFATRSGTGLVTPAITEQYNLPMAAQSLRLVFSLDGRSVGVRTLVDDVELSVTGPAASSASSVSFAFVESPPVEAGNNLEDAPADDLIAMIALGASPLGTPASSSPSLGPDAADGSASDDLLLLAADVALSWSDSEGDTAFEAVTEEDARDEKDPQEEAVARSVLAF